MDIFTSNIDCVWSVSSIGRSGPVDVWKVYGLLGDRKKAIVFSVTQNRWSFTSILRGEIMAQLGPVVNIFIEGLGIHVQGKQRCARFLRAFLCQGMVRIILEHENALRNRAHRCFPCT